MGHYLSEMLHPEPVNSPSTKKKAEKKKKPAFKKIVRKGKFGEELYISSDKEIGYTAYFRDFPQIVVQAKTVKEAQTRLWHVVYDVLKHLFKNTNKSEDEKKEALKMFATKFFYYWYNRRGNNTQEGFEDWWKKEGEILSKGIK